MRTFTTLDDVAAAAGSEIGTSDWVVVDQARIDAFADATLDHQWIHVDPVRAAAGPFGGTVAHGYLTLALVPHLTQQAYGIGNIAMGVNYGLDRVRFPAPLVAGTRIRALVDLVSVDGDDAALTAHIDVTIENEGGERPVLVARTLARFVSE